MGEDRRVYVGVRVETELLDRIDAIAEGQVGLKVPRSEVIRLALDLGLKTIEKQNARSRRRVVPKKRR